MTPQTPPRIAIIYNNIHTNWKHLGVPKKCLKFGKNHTQTKKGQKEPQKSFQYFQKYLKQPQPRSQRKIAEQIIKEENPETRQNSTKTIPRIANFI